MVSVVVCLVLGLVLVAAAGFKAAGGAAARAALATYGIQGPRVAYAAWAGLVAVEVALGVLVGAGVAWAARAAALLMAGACGVQLAALLAGRGGAPCACFGARGRLSSGSAGRTALLASALALAPILPRGDVSTDAWLAIGLAFALVGFLALSAVVL